MSPKVKFEVVSMNEVSKQDVELPKRTQPLVLVVDDERVIADTLSTILTKSGFAAAAAYDGSSALELARKIQPDLLISDVMMPGMTGIELAITVTQTIPGCKILLFSGQAATVDLLEKARHAGHNFITLTKPVHPTDMLKRISECLGTRQKQSQSGPNLATPKDVPVMASLPN
jgi:CheY-like chemotaxis protein